MAAPIGPGDWVICVDASSSSLFGWLPEEAITEGALYQVADCFIDGCGYPAVDLVGKDRSGVSMEYGFRCGYHLRRFRPLIDGEGLDISQEDSTPVHEPEAA